jgi:AraC-like DNA-binding protein
MRYREWAPHPALSPWIECFWSAADSDAPKGARENVLPDGCPEWIFHLEAPYRRIASEGYAEQPPSFVVGTTTGPFAIETTGPVSTFGVRFRPGGVSVFLPLPVSELTDLAAATEDLWNADGRLLEEEMREAPDSGSQRATIERFLLSRTRPDRAARRGVDAAVALLLGGRGAVSIADVAARIGKSRRQLERAFSEAVGVSPKTLARLARFQNVLRRSGRGRPRWAELAAECGYADQAHLIREFKEFAGESPAGLDTSRGDLAPHFVDPERLDRMLGSDVAFLQDTGVSPPLPSASREGGQR